MSHVHLNFQRKTSKDLKSHLGDHSKSSSKNWKARHSQGVPNSDSSGQVEGDSDAFALPEANIQQTIQNGVEQPCFKSGVIHFTRRKPGSPLLVLHPSKSSKLAENAKVQWCHMFYPYDLNTTDAKSMAKDTADRQIAGRFICNQSFCPSTSTFWSIP